MPYPHSTARPFVGTFLGVLCLLGAPGVAGADLEDLALCSKCVNPTIFSKTGVGSANVSLDNGKRGVVPERMLRTYP